jgi:hypothetical protein
MIIHTLLYHGEDCTPQVLTESKTVRKNIMKMQPIAERYLELDDVHHPLLATN